MYVDCELDEEQKAKFKEHVSKCLSCEEELNDMLEVIEILHSIPEVDLPDNFKDELHEKLIKVKEKEFSTKKLFFIKNRYIKVFSTIAAGVLIIFVLKGILYDDVFNKTKFGKLTATEDIKDSAVIMSKGISADDAEKACSVNGSKEQIRIASELPENKNELETDEETENQDIQKEPDKFTGEDGFFASQFTKKGESDADISEPDLLSSDTPHDRSISNTADPNDFNIAGNSDIITAGEGSADNTFREYTNGSTELVQSRALFGDRQIALDENVNTYVLFSVNGKIKATIIIKDNIIDEDRVRTIAIENGAVFKTSDINMLSIKEAKTEESKVESKEESKAENASQIVEFTISGNQYEHFLSVLDEDTKPSSANIDFTSPVIREDAEIKLNELDKKLDDINRQIAEIEKDEEDSSPTELEKLKSDKEKIQEEIDQLLGSYEYIADVTINISK